jgi:hypothetical protein
MHGYLLLKYQHSFAEAYRAQRGVGMYTIPVTNHHVVYFWR